MKLWERLGMSSRIDKEALIKGVQRFSNPADAPGPKSNAVFFPQHAAWNFYVMEDTENARRYGEMTIDSAIDYLYSDWREKVLTDEKTIDPSWWKKRAYWFKEFWYSVLWGMCLDRWDKVLKISQYPDMECYSECTQGSPEIAYRLLLAAMIRNDKLEDYQVLIDEIEKGVVKKEKLLWAVLKTITQKDVESFNKTFLEYLKYYKKREAINGGISKLACDGTILFNLARHNGLDVEFPEAYRDHYICLT